MTHLGTPRLRKGLKRLTPKPIFNFLECQRQNIRLRAVPRLRADTSRLGKVTASEINHLFDSAELDREWAGVHKRLVEMGMWNAAGATGGIDLKALYFLARRRQFQTVLEVGTHIGGSTLCLASAVAKNGAGESVTTVDIVDVNDASGPWARAGMESSPREIIREVDPEVEVSFVQSESLPFFKASSQRFDFIYLDGDHHASTVYQELCLATHRLNQGGIIALHDYSPRVIFPTLLDGYAIPGPFVATQRFVRENDGLMVRSVTRVPWDDGDRISYVAIVCQADG